ncbi:uncharacterized protein [Haliotis cracherodii]|uniref:uncharacterized protein n=1 Tax=Haliotis cracherodii TaxID=6455 RepID=UPI0039EAE80D
MMKFAAGLLCLFISVVNVAAWEDGAELKRGVPLEGRSGKKIIDGIDVTKLNSKSLNAFMDAEDEKFVGELDLQVASRYLSSKKTERKRWFALVRYAPTAFKVARKIYKNFRRVPVKTTRSGKWVTRQYTNPSGSYRQAQKDFFRLKPSDVKTIKGGYKGKLGKHDINVRRQSRPTIEIQTKKGNMNLKRKFRYGPGN